MNPKAWIAGAGALGVVLAVMLFQAPDTGAAVPERATTTKAVTRAPGDAPAVRERAEVPPPVAVEDRAGPSRANAEAAERRSQPPAVLAGRLSGPWTMARRGLHRVGTDDATAVADDISALILKLRDTRSNPEAHSLESLRADSDSIIASIDALGVRDGVDIGTSLTAIEALWAEAGPAN